MGVEQYTFPANVMFPYNSVLLLTANVFSVKSLGIIVLLFVITVVVVVLLTITCGEERNKMYIKTPSAKNTANQKAHHDITYRYNRIIFVIVSRAGCKRCLRYIIRF